jgi:hypothetical protein
MKVAVRLEWAFAATLHYCAKYPLRCFPYFTHKRSRICGDMEANSE